MGLALGSCVTHHERNVVERSKLSQPDWVLKAKSEQREGLIRLSSDVFVFRRRDLRDVTLGLRQTVNQSQWGLRYLLVDEFVKNRLNREDEARKKAFFARLLTKSASEKWSPPKPDDIYFEKIDQSRTAGSRSDSSFDVYVLIHISQQAQREFWDLLAKALHTNQPV